MLPDPAPESGSSPDEAGRSDHVVWRGLALGLWTVLAVAAVLVVVSRVRDSDDESSRRANQTFSYLVPAGTGARVDRGDVPPGLFPDYLEAFLGDRIVITNQDDRTHVLGPFTVRAGETLDYEFQEPGVYRGQCTVHGAGHDAVIRVT